VKLLLSTAVVGALFLFGIGAKIYAQVADGFDFPFGPPYGDPNGGGYNLSGNNFLTFICSGASCQYHTGEDWNRRGTSGDGDRYDPVYAIATGTVTASAFYGGCMGNTILIRHNAAPGSVFTLPDGRQVSTVWTMYTHLESRAVGVGGSCIPETIPWTDWKRRCW